MVVAALTNPGGYDSHERLDWILGNSGDRLDLTDGARLLGKRGETLLIPGHRVVGDGHQRQRDQRFVTALSRVCGVHQVRIRFPRPTPLRSAIDPVRIAASIPPLRNDAVPNSLRCRPTPRRTRCPLLEPRRPQARSAAGGISSSVACPASLVEVSRPPELSTSPSPGPLDSPAVVDKSAPASGGEAGADDGPGGGASDAHGGRRGRGPGASPAPGSGEPSADGALEESVPVSARATLSPCPVVTSTPTPSATASAPTRPM